MIDVIKADLYRYIPEPYEFKLLIKGFRSKGFKYMFFRRLRDFYGPNSIVGFISRLFLRHYTNRYGFQIGGQIGHGFYIGHFGTIVVNVNTVIGNNCNIAHNVTIGTARGKKNGTPVIGDNVWMGTGCVIVGNIHIGNNVLIAPNAYVNFDVPDHSMVIGNPGRIIPKANPTEAYINNVWKKNL